jgi:2,3-bisphosphoglycerate-independent phosphoglycerate mutase
MVKQDTYKNNLPVILIILDGWGIAPPSRGNAITLAKTPTMNGLAKKYPYTELCASGKGVGLPAHQVGNSEAGHMNIGAGRMVEQDVVRISNSIKDGTFFKNAAFQEAIKNVKKNNSTLHLMGMLSGDMSPHSDPEHILALLDLARKNGVKGAHLHLFTDGRDSPQYASLKMIEALERNLKNGERVATIMGRFYAMDRKKKWSRTEEAFNAIVLREGKSAKSPQAAITESYNRGESDEYIRPYIMTENNKKISGIKDNDSVIFFNLRSDRVRQLAKTFVQMDFNKKNSGAFKRKKIFKNLCFVALTDFGPDLDSILVAYPSADLKETLPMRLKGFKQLYFAEEEKYAHVTYFFNGGYANPVAGESRMELPSPNVKSYDETPVMSSAELTRSVLVNLKNGRYDFTVLNFAAPDMIGHTGNLKAGVACCEGVDKFTGRIVGAYLKAGGTAIITADHGNIEEMINLKTGEIDTEHSTNPVPFILANNKLRGKIKLRKGGVLGDIAPTILDIIGLEKPKEMTGKSLIK